MQKKEAKKQKAMRLLALVLTMVIFATTQGFTVMAQTVSENEVENEVVTVENEVVTVKNGENNEEMISGNSISENVVQAGENSSLAPYIIVQD